MSPITLTQLLKDPPLIHAGCSVTRGIHADLARFLTENVSVNLGVGEETSIRDLVELVASEVGFTGTLTWDTSKPNGQPRRCVGATRARELFGFEARHRLRDGMPKTVAWFLAQEPLRASGPRS